MNLALELQVAVEAEGVPARSAFEHWVTETLGERDGAAELTIRVVGEAESHELNRRYRCGDAATNVLSFPAEQPPALPEDLRTPLLGDLVICAPLVLGDAALQGKAAAAHWAHLVVHGTLHLLGYDHGCDREAAVMEQTEVEILARLGYSNPYEP